MIVARNSAGGQISRRHLNLEFWKDFHEKDVLFGQSLK